MGKRKLTGPEFEALRDRIARVMWETLSPGADGPQDTRAPWRDPKWMESARLVGAAVMETLGI